ncbi:Long-chain-fatty-acid--CoA ligase FadD13 [compost metagenome]|uniref:AMP-binding protein n=1 Tax=Pseudomonas TaxID=286 RepID=UPI000CFCB324|nr:AMP-binding protein [Pseudomonas sp. MYb187]PRA65990.1 AMP-binding protein [Pseudomonas sp. MYb187]
MPTPPLCANTVYELFQASASAYGEQPALTYLSSLDPFQEQRIGYDALLANINRAARLILDLAGTRKPVVSLLLPNIPQSQYLLWAAASVGVANPLNPLLSEDALYNLMLKAKTELIFVAGPMPGSDLWQKTLNVAQRLPHPVKCVSVMAPGGEYCFDTLLEGYRADALEPGLQPRADDIAAYFHTGGTTGLPKLARHTHANQVAAAHAYVRCMEAGPTDVALNGLPIFHVAGALVNSLGGLASGLHMLLPTPSGFRNPEVIQRHWQLVEHYGITISGGIPTSVAAMLDVPLGNHDISSLRFMISGGAPVPAALCVQLREATGLNLYQAYGMTEAAGVITLPNLQCPSIPGSAGHVSGAMEVRIASNGEICVRGPTVFPGYLEQRESPLDNGWLRTGDLGRLDELGNLYITGRAKDLIIRSGHNIDPALIENCLESHPQVSLAAAVGMPDEYAGELPVVFVQLRQGSQASAEALRQYAFENIAERPACPKQVFLIDALPVTAVGKVVKHRLRELAAAYIYNERARQHCGEAFCAEVTQQGDGSLVVNLDSVPPEHLRGCAALAERLGMRAQSVNSPICV